jgi:hypothetical protein
MRVNQFSNEREVFFHALFIACNHQKLNKEDGCMMNVKCDQEVEYLMILMS